MLGKDGIKAINTKRYAAALCAALLAASLAGCGPSVRAWDTGAAQTAADSPEVTSLAISSGEEGEAACEADRFRPYEAFGLRYDAEQDELWFNGRLVRWFEDYYPLSGDGAQAGTDFFNKNGVVDVYAVRDRSGIVRAEDGSYDPSGTLTGVEAFSEEEFAARDIKALQNPAPPTAVAGDGELSEEELEAIAETYAPFGVTYDAGENQWYYNGEKVCYFRDVLTSNGKSLTGGGFRGSMRILSSEKGTVRVETIRDFTRPDAQGYGTLTGVKIMGRS